MKYDEIQPFVDKIIMSFYGFDEKVDGQLKKVVVTDINHTGAGMFIEVLIDHSLPQIDTVRLPNPIDGATLKSDKVWAQSILFIKDGYIDYIEIYTNEGDLPVKLDDLMRLFKVTDKVH